MGPLATGDDDITGSSRFSPITETDHAGFIWVVTIIGTSYTALSLLLRVWIKYRVYGWDDALIAAGTVLHLGQSIAVWLALSYGLAKSNTVTDPADGPAASKAWFATELLGQIVFGLSKCSVLALMLRVFTPETGITAGYRACLALVMVSTVWCIASVVVISAGCNTAIILSSASKDYCPALVSKETYKQAAAHKNITNTLLNVVQSPARDHSTRYHHGHHDLPYTALGHVASQYDQGCPIPRLVGL